MIATLLAAVMLAALVLYALLGGADFGGGVWDLFALGPRAKEQRALITHAMAPVWEANHVWLILVIVILFTAFPPAFAALMTALHVPFTLTLVGIVLRGSAFVFRQYGGGGEAAETAWGHVFAGASTVTPVFLGVVMGAMTTGGPWQAAFPFTVGLFALSLFALLAAVYLCVEAKEPALRDDFRVRGLAAALVAAGFALITFLLAPRPLVSWPAAVVSLVAGGALLVALWQRRFELARAAGILLVTLVLCAWGYQQYPFFWPPDLTVQSTAAPAPTLNLLAPTLGVGALVLFPSLYWLMRVFKARA